MRCLFVGIRLGEGGEFISRELLDTSDVVDSLSQDFPFEGNLFQFAHGPHAGRFDGQEIHELLAQRYLATDRVKSRRDQGRVAFDPRLQVLFAGK